jgi:TolB-like protein/DNA-binding winged helix-turn-helix (wHTH) protein/Flp pilus assembly protein TadD
MQDATVRRFGAFEINLQTGELRKNGLRLRLSGQPFQVLAELVEHAGQVVTREELRSRLWGADTFVDFEPSLNKVIARIREVLDDPSDTPRYIETIPRRGYRFIAPLLEPRPVALPAPAAESNVRLPREISSTNARGSLDTRAEKRLGPALLSALLTGAVLIAAFAIGFVSYRSGVFSRTAQPAIKSVAVLPLKNLSGDPTQEYLADGMTEELIGRLAGIHDLRVISRTSIMRFKDTKLSAPEIAKTLRVDALVEGSVMRERDKIRVHAQLIRGGTDEHFWSQTYDREMGGVLSLQSEVADAIAQKVRITISSQEHTRLVAARHISPEVYECYLKGQFGPRNTRADLEQSIGYFEEAIRKDPTFARAYVGLANTYVNLSTIFVGGSPNEMRPKVISAARRALEVDPDLAEAHVLLADVYQKRWEWSQAEREYRRALQLKPNDGAAHIGYASWLLCRGRTEEAVAWGLRARELDPLGETSTGVAWILFQARRYEDAIRELRSVLAVHPGSASAHVFLGFALIGKGKPEEAIPELERTVSLMHRSAGSVEMLSAAYGYAGQRAEAVRLIEELKRRREKSYVPAGAFINPYLALRDYNQAFAWFERAYAEQSNILQFLKVHPFFDPIRGDPRFQDLMRRVGLK